MTAQAGHGPLTQYANYTIFRRQPGVSAPADLAGATAELEATVATFAQLGVTQRGFYDVSGFRHDGDVLVWLHGEAPENVQTALRRLRSTALLENLEVTWQVTGVHRAAEFNDRHAPAFMLGKAPATWVTIYPFVRSYDWYLLPEAERSQMLREHGQRGGAFKTVLANTVASFAISDYEWMLAFEAEELTDLVDMMRDLRYTEARRHVREEVPFYCGRRIPASEVPLALRYQKDER